MIAELCAQELCSSWLRGGSNDTSGVARMLESGLASRGTTTRHPQEHALALHRSGRR